MNIRDISLAFGFFGVACALFAVGCKGSSGGDAAPAATSAAVGSKFTDVQAILTPHCGSCHGGGRTRAGISLASYDGVMKGGQVGPIVVAGDPASSLIYKAITGASGVRQMPPRQKLDDASVSTIEAWIKAGAKND